MTKRKGKDMAYSNNNNSSTEMPATPDSLSSPSPGMLPSSLKPKLDLIFSEVEKKLPDIDFDLSDVDSDSEEPVLFHQHLKSLEEDKDLDTSQGSDSLAELSNFENKEPISSKNPITFYDNDLAYELQRNSQPPVVSSWADIPIPTDKDKNRMEKEVREVTSWNDVPTGKSETFTDITRDDRDNDRFSTNQSDCDSGVADTGNAQTDNRFVSLNSLDDKVIQKQLDREATRNKEKDLATSLVSPRAPVLSMQILDNIDLDNILENFNTDNQTAPPAPRRAWSENIKPDSTNTANVSKNSAQGDGTSAMTLIQKLAQMSMSQYGEDLSDVDPTTGARKKDSYNQQQGDDNTWNDDVDAESQVINNSHGFEKHEKEKIAEKQLKDESQKKQTSSCGTSTNNNNEPLRVITPRVRPKIPAPVKPTEVASSLPGAKGDKDPTVFIDLRNFEQVRQQQQHSIERVQKVLGIQAEKTVYSSDSDSDEDIDDWQKQRQKIKQQIASGNRPNKRPYSASDKPPVHHRQQPRVINMSELPARGSRSSDNTSTTLASTEDRELQRQRLNEAKEKEKQMEIVRKLREKQESERQAKLRLQKRLDALQPSASISGRQGPAENTPTVFDMEASYEPAPRSLPPVMSPDTDTVLLTIHLSSNGEIVLHRGSGNKSVDTGSGLSASYTTLLTWLLTLVPHNFNYLQDDVNKPQSPWMLPFYVVGLQQLLLDGQLCLMVAVTPVEQFDAKYVQGKSRKNKKSDVKNSTAFQQHLQKLFSTNTLHSVCPWLQNMVSMELGPGGEETEQDTSYIYKPPLPNITTKPLSTFIHVNPDLKAAEKVFNSSVGFFWQTVDNEEGRLDQDLHDEGTSYDTQNTLSLIYKKIYQEPSAMMGIFNRVLQLGLDLAGVRLVYPSPEQMNIPQADNASVPSEMDLLNNVGAVLSLCIRGAVARSLWLDAVGPSDPVLARRTDPNSLCALYGGDSRDECLLFCPRTAARVQTELARWFGGRVPPGNVIDVGTPYTKKESLRSGSPKGRRGKKVTFSDSKDTSDHLAAQGSIEEIHRPLATLTATAKSEIMLVMSPLVPPKCFGIILASCQRRGFQLTGVRRTRLSNKRAAALGITGEGLKAFCPGSTVESFDASLADHVDPQGRGQWRESIFPSTVLQLLKENSSHSAASLVEDCMVQLTMQGIMGTLQNREGYPLQSVHMFHAARYSDNLLSSLGGDFSKCFDPEVQINPNYVIPQLYTNPELEQITVLLLLGNQILKSSGLFVGKLLGMLPYSRHQQTLPFIQGLELLGMKWTPGLSVSQAKEITPCEVGDRLWKNSLHTLANEPCLALALRGVDAYNKLESVVQPRSSTDSDQSFNLEMIHARTPEEAYTYIRLFFTERELFSDPLARPMLPYIPMYQTKHEQHSTLSSKPVSNTSTYPVEESIFELMLSGPRPFTTFLVIKPRAVQRHLSKILKKLALEGFKIVSLKLQYITAEQSQRLIPESTEENEKDKHVQHMASGPSLLLCVQRENAVRKLLDLLGPEDPQSARRQSQFYWRGVFGTDNICNAIYASKTFQSAVDDQKYFFPDGLCCEENDICLQEMIPCPAVDSEIDMKHFQHRSVKSNRTSDSTTSEPSHVLLQQTNCVVLTPFLMRKLGAHYGYVDVIEGLIAQGFELVGGRMVWLTQDQARQVLCLVDAGSFQQVPLLVSGPVIVLALERDNAVLAFDTILREAFSTESSQGKSVTDSLLHKYGKLILRPTEIKQAENMLGFFFQDLLPNSQLQIVKKSD